jgi:hypothetical protein
MAFAINTLPGAQPIAETSTTKKHLLGTIVRATDATLGEGEFIYLQGIGSTVVGSIVSYGVGFVTALDTAAATGPSNPLAIAMSANVASQYGWYQISGLAVATKADTVSFAAGAGFTTSAGLAVAVVTGRCVLGGVVRVVASAKTAVTTVALAINRPHNQDYK